MNSSVGLWLRLFSCTRPIEKQVEDGLVAGMDAKVRETLYQALGELKRSIAKGPAFES